jgi:hypothetical protein
MMLSLLSLCFSLLAANLITVDPTTTTYSLSQSTAAVQLWTTPQTRRIRSTMTTVPAAQRSTLSVFCGREELESFQLIIAPSNAGSVAVSMGMFAGLPDNAWLERAQATFSPVSPWGRGRTASRTF